MIQNFNSCKRDTWMSDLSGIESLKGEFCTDEDINRQTQHLFDLLLSLVFFSSATSRRSARLKEFKLMEVWHYLRDPRAVRQVSPLVNWLRQDKNQSMTPPLITQAEIAALQMVRQAEVGAREAAEKNNNNRMSKRGCILKSRTGGKESSQDFFLARGEVPL